MSDYEKIRNFESNVLDRHHESYAFFHYSDDVVIPYLLQTYGDTERHRDNLVRSGHTATNVSFYLNNLLHGVGHCIRWVAGRKMQGKEFSGEPPQQLLAIATDFAGWGIGYHMIAQEFVTWSRGIKTAILDEGKRTVSFINPKGYDYSRIYESQLLYAERMAAVYESYPHDEMQAEFSEWVKEVDFRKPPIANHIKWKRARTSKSYPLLYRKMEEILFPELDETTDFLGYDLKQLRQFYALVFLNFYFIRWVEDLLDSSAGEDKLSFGSNPLYLNQNHFERLTSDITGFDVDVVRAIIKDLTFNISSFHTSISIQPFIRSSSGMYYVLPNLFAQLEPSRMILGALNKGLKKNTYDALINTIEKSNMNIIHSVVKEIPGSDCYVERVIKIIGLRIQPDIILIDSSTKSVFVADYKHYIGPITASEVDYKMKELKKAIVQVEKYVEQLLLCSKIGAVEVQGFSVAGLIITHKPLPIPVLGGNRIPIVDMATFIEMVRSGTNERKGIADIMQNIHDNHIRLPTSIFQDYESEISVGDWTVLRVQHKIA